MDGPLDKTQIQLIFRQSPFSGEILNHKFNLPIITITNVLRGVKGMGLKFHEKNHNQPIDKCQNRKNNRHPKSITVKFFSFFELTPFICSIIPENRDYILAKLRVFYTQPHRPQILKGRPV